MKIRLLIAFIGGLCLCRLSAQDTLYFNQKPDCADAELIDLTKVYVIDNTFNGSGADMAELDLASCITGLGPGLETASTWFRWKCTESKLIEFKITPFSYFDDIDFFLFKLVNGECGQKEELRCMATSCDGPTGLLLGETDFAEPPNCFDPSIQSNFLAPLEMLEGEEFALAVNNFSANGNGFLIDFFASEVNGVADVPTERPSISVSPNPVSETLSVELHGTAFEEVQIVDISGRVLQIHYIQQDGRINIPVGHLGNGFFWVRATGRLGTVEQKFVHFSL